LRATESKSKSAERASTLFKRRYVVFAPGMLNLGQPAISSKLVFVRSPP
jgi:hypothetical protein